MTNIPPRNETLPLKLPPPSSLPFRRFLKETHNERFGSVFRTEKNPTYFTRRLATFANLYMSSLDSLMNYSLDYTFMPRRGSLPHEPDLNFDL